MAWSTADGRAGTGVPGVVYDTAIVPVGSIMNFIDPIYGEGTFIFLPGVASTARGDVVDYTAGNGAASPVGSTTRWAGTIITGRPLAIATAATIAGTWGWYQVVGLAVVTISGVIAAGNSAYWQAAGVVQAAAVAGKQMVNAIAVSANGVPAAGQATYQIAWPFAQGAIT